MAARSLLLFGLIDPERDRATDDRGGGQRTEIASVERVGGPRVHQEDVALSDGAAALPDRKRAAAAIALAGIAHFDCVDSDAAADTTDRLSGDRRHVFQQRHSARQIAAIGTMTSNKQPFRVLSLDGGGMRGTYTATYLERVGDTFAKKRGLETLDIGAAFDLIVGTSTGGIIACALAAGVPLAEVVSLYAQNGTRIFSRRLPSGWASTVCDLNKRPSALAKGTEVLREALAERLKDKTLGQIYAQRGIGLAIPSVEMSQHRAWVFKTPHLAATTNDRDDNYKLVDVCLATTAAPLYRSLAAIGHPDSEMGGFNVFVDGGLWSNNPVLVGLIDALDLTVPGQEIHIFCLGTCPLAAGEQIAKSEIDRGLREWGFGGNAAGLAVDAQQFAFDHMAKKLARHLDRKCTVIRFPSEKVPATLIPYLDLDETRDDAVKALINQARADADMTNSKCAYADADPEAALICSLFDSAPLRTDPLVSRSLWRDGSARGN
jgi:predicted acylesterase/phospholipase RssA